jgi:chromatin structure-remodeling complex subunit SFH1
LTDFVGIFLAEKLITPDSFARTFCDDLELGPDQMAEVSRQITEQIDEQAGMAEVPFRSPEDERDLVEKDLRVIINVSLHRLSIIVPKRSIDNRSDVRL